MVGNLESLVREYGVNAEKFRSFELLRRNTFLPEIITFDEPYERARFIVQQNEGYSWLASQSSQRQYAAGIGLVLELLWLAVSCWNR